MTDNSPRIPNLPGSRVEPFGLSLARPWRSPGDPAFRPWGIVVFAVGLVAGLLALGFVAIGGGWPDPIVWPFVIAILATDLAELPVSSSRGGEYKVVLNDVLVFVPFATFASHDLAWLLLVATVAAPLLLPLSWGMRFAHVSSGLAYRGLHWAAAAVVLASGGSPFAAVLAMGLVSVVYEFTLFWPFAHVLLQDSGRPYAAFVREAAPVQAILFGVHVPLALVGVAAIDVAPWAVPTLAIPILICWRIALLGPRLRELNEADRMKSRFISMASHELQTPLTSVVGFAATLDDRWESLDSEQRRRFLRIIREQGERLSRLVSQMLALSSVDAGNERPARQVEVAAAVEQALHTSGVEDVEVEVESGLVVLADEGDLVRIFVNLLTNAAKYGEPPIRIVARRIGGAWALVEVIDHGPGVPQDERRRIFEHFARGADVRSDVDGSGLGLAIARTLARSYGGELAYAELPGMGACFELRLPRPASSDAANTPVSGSSESIRTATSSPSVAVADSTSTGE